MSWQWRNRNYWRTINFTSTYPATKEFQHSSKRSNKWQTSRKKLRLSTKTELSLNTNKRIWIDSMTTFFSIYQFTVLKLNKINSEPKLKLTSSTLISDFLIDLMVNDGFDRHANKERIRCPILVKEGVWLSNLLAIEMQVRTRNKIWFFRLVRVPCHDTSELLWTSRTTSETCFRMKLLNKHDAILPTWIPGISKWWISSRMNLDNIRGTSGWSSLHALSSCRMSMTRSGGDTKQFDMTKKRSTDVTSARGHLLGHFFSIICITFILPLLFLSFSLSLLSFLCSIIRSYALILLITIRMDFEKWKWVRNEKLEAGCDCNFCTNITLPLFPDIRMGVGKKLLNTEHFTILRIKLFSSSLICILCSFYVL